MSEFDEGQVWQDEDNLVMLSDVLRTMELFGGVLLRPTQFLGADELDDSDEDAEVAERQDMTVARFGLDEEAFDFFDAEYSVVRKSTVDARPEKEPSGHEWTSSQVVKTVPKMVRHAVSHSDCGKPLSECYKFDCKHWQTDVWYEFESDIRNEFHDSGFSPSDRPSENFWLGLPGLRATEDVDVTVARWYYRNTVCSECHILTPKCENVCQNCDSVLVN